MAVVCPRCNRQYDITLFQFGRRVVCECGEVIQRDAFIRAGRDERKGRMTPEQVAAEKAIARQRMTRLRRAVDRVCTLILIADYPEIDIEIEKGKVRELAEELFPGRMDLFEMIYESRFRRLWEQFRSSSDDLPLFRGW
jgi:hypothetical protein